MVLMSRYKYRSVGGTGNKGLRLRHSKQNKSSGSDVRVVDRGDWWKHVARMWVAGQGCWWHLSLLCVRFRIRYHLDALLSISFWGRTGLIFVLFSFFETIQPPPNIWLPPCCFEQRRGRSTSHQEYRALSCGEGGGSFVIQAKLKTGLLHEHLHGNGSFLVQK